MTAIGNPGDRPNLPSNDIYQALVQRLMEDEATLAVLII